MTAVRGNCARRRGRHTGELFSPPGTGRLRAWDFRPGFNFAIRMQQVSKVADRIIAVLSPDYLTAEFTQPEWAAAFGKDPRGEKGLLLPVRVRDCEPEGMLQLIVYIDLVNLEEMRQRWGQTTPAWPYALTTSVTC